MKNTPILLAMNLISLAFFPAPHAFASGHEVGHGGNTVGLEFEQAFLRALDNIEAGSPQLGKIQLPSHLDATLKRAKVYAVDKNLVLDNNGVELSCVAVNDRKSVITVNIEKWGNIADTHLKEGIALHEFLSLDRSEDTGQYPISAKYLAAFDLPESALISGDSGYRKYLSVALDFDGIIHSLRNSTSTAYFAFGESPAAAEQNALNSCRDSETILTDCKLPSQMSSGITADSTEGCITVITDPDTGFYLGVGKSLLESKNAALLRAGAPNGPLQYIENSKCAY